MSNFRFFVEGKPDMKFLKDYIEEVLKISLSENYFDTLGSWSGYKAGGELKASIKQNFEDKKQTILILDADTSFQKRQVEVQNDFEIFNVPISLFLFPNNSSHGSLEVLLCEIAVHQNILDCFGNYESCINGYESPVVKSKIFAYLDALLPANKKKGDSKDQIQERNRNYRDHNHWNLNHDSLKPLKEFLQPLIAP